MSLRMETDKTINVITEGAIEPCERLANALAEQRALETSKSDEAAVAGRLAVTICGLAGQFGLNSRDMAARSDGWALLSAAA
ncbi:MAG: hypothetical protein ABL952_12955, partial [Pyrinomonadaceae bacterium]